MDERKHIINKQVLELTVPEKNRAVLIQNKASEIVRQKLQVALDTAFSRISGPDKILRIDKLEVDLGTISEEELEKTLVDKTIEQVEKKIETNTAPQMQQQIRKMKRMCIGSQLVIEPKRQPYQRSVLPAIDIKEYIQGFSKAFKADVFFKMNVVIGRKRRGDPPGEQPSG